MKYRYESMSFGEKDKRIRFIHFKKPLENGLAGMVSSRLFEKEIAIVVETVESESTNYDFACLARTGNNDVYMVIMNRDIFYGIKRGDIMSRTVFLHELGHYVYKHLESAMVDMEEYDSIRYQKVMNGFVTDQEKEADAFAVQYLGEDYVCEGLSLLKEKLALRYQDGGRDTDEIKAALTELDMRIKIVSN